MSKYIILNEQVYNIGLFAVRISSNFYRGEFAELLFCHIVNVVDKGLRVVTMRTDLKLIGKKRYIVDWVDKGCQWFTSVYSISGILKVFRT